MLRKVCEPARLLAMGSGGTTRKARDQAQKWTSVLRTIKAMPNGWCEVFQLTEAMYPPPAGPRGHVDGRTREGREWHRRWLAVMRVWVDLIEAGLVEIIIPADGIHPDLFRLSEAGHRWLVEHDALTGDGT